ncbi:uncharacterized protein LOC110746073 [Prunus avium]|uniref:Uncharacterized protein LOC110746073 n=1 Tax=Prunus avium TaxID=42229 RepID=A0A6P5RG80_PRUAV|nr:uncharacterized protein LOC110746073 [Prunus avium]
MRELPRVAMKNLKNLLGIRKSVDPDPRRLVLSSLTHLGSLTELDLCDYNIGEGAIPDDIGRLSSLKGLKLSGNNFVSLPSSIRFLSELVYLELERCKRLERLPDLPSSKYLFVNVNDCTSLNGLSDPSKLSEGANVYDFGSSCVNCFRLVEEGGWIWINRIFAMILTMATCPDNSFFGPSHTHRFAWLSCTHRFVWPGSEIPEWFDNRSVGDSIIVELPLPPQTCSDWVGIALCIVFEDSETCSEYDYLEIYTSPMRSMDWTPMGSMDWPKFKVGHLGSQHLWVFYLPRDKPRLKDASGSHRFSFEGHYSLSRWDNYKHLNTSSIIKKCGARLVYQRDLEEFSRILKILMPAALQASDDEEAGPIGSSGSGSSDDHDEP